MKVKMLPTNEKYKELIEEFGDVWNVVRELTCVPCLNNNRGYYIESQDKQHCRWIKVYEVKFHEL